MCFTVDGAVWLSAIPGSPVQAAPGTVVSVDVVASITAVDGHAGEHCPTRHIY